MKKQLLLVSTLFFIHTGFSQGYEIKVKAPAIKQGISYLTYYMGNNYNIADSAAFSNQGTAIFKGAEPLKPGIYALFFPGNRLRVEFLIDNQQSISVSVPDTTDLVNKTVITGSKENELYEAYQKFATEKGKLIQQERTAFMASKTLQDSALHESNFKTYNNQMNDYREGLIKNNPNSMMAALLKAMKEPALPAKVPVTRQDSIDNYNKYKNHYWDGVTFMDDRIIRSPFFLKKLETYYRDVMPQMTDSIIKDVDYKLLLARTAPEMYKFLLNWLTDEYINPRIMGLDAVFVHLFNKYHSKGLSSWLNKEQMDAINRRAYMLMANLIGEKAAPLELIDSTGKSKPLYDLTANYTVVVFWDPNCGHCREEVPRLDSIYQASWKAHGVRMYAVLTPDSKAASSKTDWVNYIKDKNLGEWAHVYQTKEMEAADQEAQRPGFRQLYDVTMTPTVFLLDNEKRIIGKKLTWQQLNELLEVKWKTNPSK